MFIDRVSFQVKAGTGGNGLVSWRRERYIPKGGPNGGNGSKGGDVIFEADVEIFSLDWYRKKKVIQAENGGHGGVNLRQGKKGQDLILKVPCGTLVRDKITQEILADLTEPGQRHNMCQGGKGGRGNTSFKTPTNQAPNYCTPGKEGEELDIELELKLIADIGLVGFPNAGKSTLISSIANIKVKIAPYPFTTLQPNLGIIRFENYSRILIADIPGIIEGASENKGLGFAFLRHIERTKALVYILDCSGIDGRHPIDDFLTLQNELKKYNPELLEKPFAIILNKMDVEESKENAQQFQKQIECDPSKLFLISADQKNDMVQIAHVFYQLTH